MAHKDMFESDHLDQEDEENHDEAYYSGKFNLVPKTRSTRQRNGEVEQTMLKLRACINCHLVLSEDQFYDNGCGNCPHLQMDGDRRRILDCTSSNFSGLISIIEPQKSWAAKFNRLGDNVTGCYAISVVGDLPESVREDIGR